MGIVGWRVSCNNLQHCRRQNTSTADESFSYQAANAWTNIAMGCMCIHACPYLYDLLQILRWAACVCMPVNICMKYFTFHKMLEKFIRYCVHIPQCMKIKVGSWSRIKPRSICLSAEQLTTRPNWLTCGQLFDHQLAEITGVWNFKLSSLHTYITDKNFLLSLQL